jgi:hypothetical protein
MEGLSKTDIGSPVQDRVEANRSHLRHFKPFFVYLPLGAIFLTWVGVAAPFSWKLGTLMFVLGAVSWTLLEYGIHRWAFHFRFNSREERPLLSRSHLAHHDDPKAIEFIFVRLHVSVPVSLLIFIVLWGGLGQWQEAVVTLTGMWAGYLFYEFMHYSAHFRTPQTRPMRFLKKYHMLHHHQDEHTRFGVTTPLLDWLFGTYRPISAKSDSHPQMI